MHKIILASLVGLLLVAGTAGVAAASQDAIVDGPLEALKTWSRQVMQTQDKIQDKEQLHIQINEAVEDADLPIQLQTQTQMQLQDREKLQLQDQVQIQLNQEEALQIMESYQWTGESPTSGNGSGFANGQDQAQQFQNKKGQP